MLNILCAISKLCLKSVTKVLTQLSRLSVSFTYTLADTGDSAEKCENKKHAQISQICKKEHASVLTVGSAVHNVTFFCSCLRH